jgi:hypothetical protein
VFADIFLPQISGKPAKEKAQSCAENPLRVFRKYRSEKLGEMHFAAEFAGRKTRSGFS